MRQLLIILCFIIAGTSVRGQAYYNEWIDYSKTYYKFKVGKTGLYRINQQTLANAGLGSIPAEQFQLWRNGEEVAIYTSVPSGIIPANGYIEFWGEKNDGNPDRGLYKDPNNQLSLKLSLETDTAAYFMTVTNGPVKRIADAVNDVTGNTLPPDPYFMYRYEYNYQAQINFGKAVYFGEYVYSSTYDAGEFWSSTDIRPPTPIQVVTENLFVATTGPSATFRASFAGNSYLGGSRFVKAEINGTTVLNQSLPNMNVGVFSNNAVALSVLGSTAATVRFSNVNGDPNDRMVVGFFEINYPRLFNFGGKTNFEFSLPATTKGNYLEISNFNWGNGTPPVLYDLTNNKRYTANTGNPALLRFALPASAQSRKLVLVSEATTNITSVSGLTQRNFIDYRNAGNQGNYIIISNKRLFNPGGTNPVEQYRQYRSSTEGGGYTAIIADIDELTDQFAFGIKMHPLSIKNFLRFARNNFASSPKFAFLIGKAVTYNEFRLRESSVHADKLNLVPTFGWPASDNLLGSDNMKPVPATPIGRLAAIYPDEVSIYLDKIKQYEQQQQNTVQTIENKAWMKTMVHVVGANDISLDASLTAHLNNYRDIIEDTLYGANVTSFNRTATGPETPATNALMESLFNDGISLLNYFGHSAATQLDYNLNSPDQFDNYGKYPVFTVNGCNAGNIYSFDTSRLQLITSLSEKFVLAKDKGAIGFIASTHFGVESYLDAYNDGFYKSLSSRAGYGQPVSINIRDGINFLISTRYLDSTTRYLHGEENVLHGDPALKINYFPKPDFAVEDSKVIIDPTFISVADNQFKVKVYFYNLGMATGDSVRISLKRQYPDGSMETILQKNILSVRFDDSVMLTIPIVAIRDVGTNKLIVSIDDDSRYEEITELNNSVTKIFVIYEDDIKPVYPYNFSIVNKSNIKLVASTADPLSEVKQYTMQIDTTELFNSPLLRSETISSSGGAIEFNPQLTFTDSTVYYWRVAIVPADGNYLWNKSSFVYLPGSSLGYNQSHLYQHLKSGTERMYIDSFSRKWQFVPRLSAFNIVNSVFPTSGSQPADFQIQINGQTVTASACLGFSVIFNVFDPVTLKPLFNQAIPSTNPSGVYGGFLGSAMPCNGDGKSGTETNFEFSYKDTTGRRKMRDFMDWVPNGYFVTARLIMDQPYDQTPFAATWKNDETVYGAGNTAYNRLVSAGFTDFDDWSFPRTWAFMYKKNDGSFTPESRLSTGLFDKVVLPLEVATPDTLGYITSPVLGPATAWKQVKWRGSSLDSKAGDRATLEVIGVTASGAESILFTFGVSQQDADISSADAATYPYLKLRMRNADSINLTPYQLRYWRVLYDPVPEGALAPNILYSFKDTLNLGEQSVFRMAFKNVSDVAFADSIKLNVVVFDANNVANIIPANRLKQLNPGDTATISFMLDSKNFNGPNNLFVDVNPDNDQPEQTHFNNFLYTSFAVAADNYKPVLDVTFDGVHILNNDIVSAQPHILIKLKDESRFLLLDDTSLVTIQLVYPDGSNRRFYFNNDTLRFTPANSQQENVATVDFTPLFLEDGAYQLIVHGKDKTGNTAGNLDFTVTFQVYNKPMISNLFNYPNPFTTSTAFVFTITGSQVPQNIRIQVLTITGKIVKEITKEELGPLHIGRNITDYKWDGTDEYGQKLANGVYLYRVLTNLNGKQLDKFPTVGKDGVEVNTDKYFNKGYGKMYLMR